MQIPLDVRRQAIGRLVTPGTVFLYNSGTTNVFADVIRKQSGMLLAQFAEQTLFNALGITQYRWMRCPVDARVTFASGGLYLTPRDMNIRSANEDDRRLANLALRTDLNMEPTRLELIWVPFYAPSRLPRSCSGSGSRPESRTSLSSR